MSSSLPSCAPSAASSETPRQLYPLSDASEGSSDSDDDRETGIVTEGNRRRRRQRVHFNLEQLQAVYHLPLKTAAERLGVCEAALKRICRRNRIHKWPYRQLASVRRRIAELEERRTRLQASPEDVGGSDCAQPAGDSDRLQLDARLRRLQEEQARIIRRVHQQHPKTRHSDQEQPPAWQRRLVPGETLTLHLRGCNANVVDPAPLNLDQVERDFPLLFLANVCESVRVPFP